MPKSPILKLKKKIMKMASGELYWYYDAILKIYNQAPGEEYEIELNKENYSRGCTEAVYDFMFLSMNRMGFIVELVRNRLFELRENYV